MHLTGYEADWEGLLASLQQKSDGALLIVRNEKGLLSYQAFLQDLWGQLEKGCAPESLQKWLQIRNLAQTGQMIAAAALERKESRGSHYRADYPDLDPSLGQMLLIQKKDGQETSCHWASAG